MKQIIYIVAMTGLLLSCTNEIPFNVKETAPKLIINALLDANKETNDIILGLTGIQKTELMDKATVDIYVNGELVEQITEPIIGESNGDKIAKYTTNARFLPDDIIKIEARSNDGQYHAWAEVIVPHPIQIEKVDTTIYLKNYYMSSTSKFLRIKTTFTDNKQGRNYYRIAMCYKYAYHTISPITSNDTIIHKTEYNSLFVNEDIVLTDGTPTMDDDNSIFTPIINNYGVFDNSRINGSYTMIVSMMYPYLSSYLGFYEPEWYDDLKLVEVDLDVHLLSISETYYYYLKALNTYDSDDYDDYLNLPVKFPSNVQGGVGVVGVSTGNGQTIHLADMVPEPW